MDNFAKNKKKNTKPMSSMYDALPVALPPTTSPLNGSGGNGNVGRSSVSPTGSHASVGRRSSGGNNFRSNSISTSPSVSNGHGHGHGHGHGQTPSPSHHANSCMLVNGSQRKLSNSYLRYQRRYSKHGYTRHVFT